MVLINTSKFYLKKMSESLTIADSVVMFEKKKLKENKTQFALLKIIAILPTAK